ncbi:MAG TPA: hypothetical protein VK072_07820, partial [Candidatus Avamphibacillus sp.]|nr:hypothetical protein [Candidatus Avamphibacillus sp.]
VILCERKAHALESIRVIQAIMDKLDLSLHPEKSSLVNIWDDSDGFEFFGFHHRKFPIRKKGGHTFFFRGPVINFKRIAFNFKG